MIGPIFAAKRAVSPPETAYCAWSPLLTLRNEHRTYLATFRTYLATFRTYLATFLAKWTTLAISGITERREGLKSLSVSVDRGGAGGQHGQRSAFEQGGQIALFMTRSEYSGAAVEKPSELKRVGKYEMGWLSTTGVRYLSVVVVMLMWAQGVHFSLADQAFAQSIASSLPRLALFASGHGLVVLLIIVGLLWLSRENLGDIGFTSTQLGRQLGIGALFGFGLFILHQVLISPVIDVFLPSSTAQGVDMTVLFGTSGLTPGETKALHGSMAFPRNRSWTPSPWWH